MSNFSRKIKCSAKKQVIKSADVQSSTIQRDSLSEICDLFADPKGTAVPSLRTADFNLASCEFQVVVKNDFEYTDITQTDFFNLFVKNLFLFSMLISNDFLPEITGG